MRIIYHFTSLLTGLLEAQSSTFRESTLVIPKLIRERAKRHEHSEKLHPEVHLLYLNATVVKCHG